MTVWTEETEQTTSWSEETEGTTSWGEQAETPPNLITNPGFDNNVDGWTQLVIGTGTFKWLNGLAEFVSFDDSNRGAAFQTLDGLAIGAEYIISYQAIDIGGELGEGWNMNAGTIAGTYNYIRFEGQGLPYGKHTFSFIAIDTDFKITFAPDTGNTTTVQIGLDNVSLTRNIWS